MLDLTQTFPTQSNNTNINHYSGAKQYIKQHCSSKGSRRPISLQLNEDTQPVIRAIVVPHTAPTYILTAQ